MNRFILAVAVVIAAAFSHAQELPVSHFFKSGDFLSMTLSPDGKYIAARVRNGDEVWLIFLDRETMQPVHGMRPHTNDELHEVQWVNDERVVVTYAEKYYDKDSPVLTGELFGINVDGSNNVVLAGRRASATAVGARLGNRVDEYASFEVIDTLEEEPRFVLVAEFPWQLIGNTFHDNRVREPVIHKLNVRNGSKQRIETIPFQAQRLLTDGDGVVRFVTWLDESRLLKASYRDSSDTEWRDIGELSDQLAGLTPVKLSDDGEKLFLRGPFGPESFETIMEYNFANGELTTVFDDVDADVQWWYVNPRTGEVDVGVTQRAQARYHYRDTNSSFSSIHRSLSDAFQGQNMSIVSSTNNHDYLILYVWSDVNAGEFYSFNTNTSQAEFLGANMTWLDPRTLRPMINESVVAEDGLEIPVRLTLPQNHENAPVLVLTHGGPHGISDDWGFSREVQFFANRGYAVIQVNYRGSGNFGREFSNAGYREWGDAIISDIHNSSMSMIEKYKLDADRVCAYGASFGGYASMMLAAQYPDAYQCTVGYVGIYDLSIMYDSGNIPRLWGGEGYLNRAIGTDEEELRAFSPVSHAADITANVMLIHGLEDQQAPPEHAERMREALQQAGNEPEWLVYSRAGHGIGDEEDEIEMYTKLLNFLDQSLNSIEISITN